MRNIKAAKRLTVLVVLFMAALICLSGCENNGGLLSGEEIVVLKELAELEE